MRKRGGQREREKEDVKVNRSRYIKCDQTSVVGLGGMFMSKVVAVTQSSPTWISLVICRDFSGTADREEQSEGGRQGRHMDEGAELPSLNNTALPSSEVMNS